ncbi:MAG TPA: DUF1501 domain-containing protein [Tepidisphaeraceae bacterium]|jgi:hypothetical protein|nr:DUF1501 domain-containing protein [Tepidisphaeraceae bacterium]
MFHNIHQHPRNRPFASPQRINLGRRDFLRRAGGGFGAVALAHLLSQADLLAAENPQGVVYANGGLHHPAKAKRVIQLFMNGGVSQMDTFDYKPLLTKLHGQPFSPGSHFEAATSVPGAVLGSPFSFKQYGQCGRWVSDVFPNLAGCVDDIAFLMAMGSKTNVHGPGSYMMNTGFVLPGFPCMGAWISYGLGRLCDNLPSFVVMPDPRGLPYNNMGDFSSGFLPVAHAGTIIKPTAPTPIADLFPPADEKYITKEGDAEGLALLNRLNRAHARENPGDSRLESRIASYELAAKMQLSAPEVLDISNEPAETKELYGLNQPASEEFGRRCLVARRMLERGVRFVQVWSGAGGPTNNWDNHANIQKELPPMAAATDRPAAALLHDLKRRGMLDDTLIIWSTEFGRMPFSQGSTGRDHNGGTFVSWLAGAGVKGGTSFGQSDEWGWKAHDPTYCYDMHATILHILGIDHKKLTYRINGIDRRLTDVHGEVIREVLA